MRQRQFPEWTRRTMLAAGAAGLASGYLPNSSLLAAADHVHGNNALSLGALAAEKGLLFGASFAVHELSAPHGSAYADIYSRDARIVTSELEFKMAELRPTPDTLEFGAADKLMAFADSHQMKVRGHTLIWNDNLPEWISKLAAKDAGQLLETHITTVMERYATRVAYWDVVNEPIGPWDNNPGNLRGGPFYSALGEDYIAKAFRIARDVAPTAKLVLNEAQTETADDNGQTFRASLLDLLKRLKAGGVPIDAVGLQSHLKLSAPYDLAAYAGYLSEIASLGYEIHLTELDVNDSGVPGSVAERDAAVAGLYERYLNAVLAEPAVKVVELWQLADGTSWMRDPALPARIKMRPKARPLIYDDHFNRKPAWDAVARALSQAPVR